MPTALPLLGPFAFLCHQKWDSASKIPLIPLETPILMLSGVKDEVVPREHMQGLWELIQKRVPGGEKDDLLTDKDKREQGPPEVRLGTGPGYSRYVEFEKGTHSTCRALVASHLAISDR